MRFSGWDKCRPMVGQSRRHNRIKCLVSGTHDHMQSIFQIFEKGHQSPATPRKMLQQKYGRCGSIESNDQLLPHTDPYQKMVLENRFLVFRLSMCKRFLCHAQDQKTAVVHQFSTKRRPIASDTKRSFSQTTCPD